ncbi:MAG: hypothetical protein ACT6FG_00340 [Methanosarcinaceae archaeon]
MTIERINAPVTWDAKQVLLNFQKENNIRDQGNALTELLLQFKELKKEKDK